MNICWRQAFRVIGVEFLQNLPITLGLVAAIRATDWPLRLLAAALGALGSAWAIALTEGLKLGTSTTPRPSDMPYNAAAFFLGSLLYLVYLHGLRSRLTPDWLADSALGAGLGGLLGLAQGRLVDERRLNRQALTHAAALGLAGAFVLVMFGLAASSPAPAGAVLYICLTMTAIIVWLDYRALLRAPGRH